MKLYVGNLPPATTESELEDWFRHSGLPTLSAGIAEPNGNGQSRAIGFVEMLGPFTAKKAIQQLNGKRFGNLPIDIREIPPAGPVRHLFNILLWSHELFQLEASAFGAELGPLCPPTATPGDTGPAQTDHN